MVEEISATSIENAEIAAIILSRSTFSELEEIKILSLAYHLQRVFPLYQKELKNFKVKPLLAETFLPLEKVIEYYSVPKAKKMWDIQKIMDNPSILFVNEK